MDRRQYLGTLALAGAGVLAGCIDGSGDGLNDDGGLTGFTYLDRLEWDESGTLIAVFASDHATDFFAISHEVHVGDHSTVIHVADSPDFDGRVVIEFGELLQRDGRDFPSREFGFDFYKTTLGQDVRRDETHIGSDAFSVPEAVDLDSGRSITLE